MATLRETFKDIADAIRGKGVSGSFKPIEMATKIGQISGGGGQDYGYLTFTATTSEGTTLKMTQAGGIAPHKLLKSTDGVNWTKWDNPSTNGISIGYGESVYIKADEDALWRTATSSSAYNKLTSTKGVECSGDIRSLTKSFHPCDYSYWVGSLFSGCSTLTQAPELPATALAGNCYSSMFYNCTSLVEAPDLPATTLVSNCYSQMFYGCKALTQAPELPATALAGNCYDNMFKECSSLTQAPELPATTLASSCYNFMFSYCKSLVSAPQILPATTMVSNCYNAMFYNCTSLEQGPELPATAMTTACYQYMFEGCTKLKRIKMNASSGTWGSSMFSGCTSLELVDMTGSTAVPQLSNVNNFNSTNDTYKIVVPDSLYNTWIAATNWVKIASHIMKQSDWNAEHPDDILG